METSFAADENNLQQKTPAVPDEDHPATAKKKRGKRKKKDLRKWLANCDLAAALEATANPH